MFSSIPQLKLKRLMLQEENINFWIAVTAFHRDDLVAPQGCTKIVDIREDTTFEQLRLMRTQMISEEFINEGSPREVNISKSMRENVQQRIDLNDISKVKYKIFRK